MHEMDTPVHTAAHTYAYIQERACITSVKNILKRKWHEGSSPLLFFHEEGRQSSKVAKALELSAGAGLPDQ